MDKVLKRLQDPKMGFNQAFRDLKILIQILNLRSEEIMHNTVNSANEYCEKWEIPIARPRRKKITPREIAHDSGLTAQQEINLVMVEIVNRTKTEVEDCSICLQDLTDRFLFILNLSSIDIEHEQEKEKLRKEFLGFANYHDKDVKANQLHHDIIDFFMFLQARENAAPSNLTHALECFM